MSKPDLSEFLSLSQPRKKPCAVRLALDTLSRDDQARLVAALAADPSLITNSAVAKWLELRGQRVAWQVVNAHRKAACDCGRA